MALELRRDMSRHVQYEPAPNTCDADVLCASPRGPPVLQGFGDCNAVLGQAGIFAQNLAPVGLALASASSASSAS